MYLRYRNSELPVQMGIKPVQFLFSDLSTPSTLGCVCVAAGVAKARLSVGSVDAVDVKLGMHKYIREICKRERRWPVEQFSLFHVLRTLILNFKTIFFERKKRDIFNGLTILKCSNIIILSLLCILTPGSAQVFRTDLTSVFSLADVQTQGQMLKQQT